MKIAILVEGATEKALMPSLHSKTRDGLRILEENDLMESIQVCSEFKTFINTILLLCGGEEIL